MRRAIITLALALGVAGCGLFPPSYDTSPSGAMANMGRDLGWGQCDVEIWVTGVIVRGASGGVVIRDDSGYEQAITWGSQNTGGVDWDRRYKIGGRRFAGLDSLWACGGADAVIPQ